MTFFHQATTAVFSASPFGRIAGVVFTALLIGACVWDVKTRRIPNRLVGVLAIAGLAYSLVSTGAAHPTIFSGLWGLLVGFGVWLPFYLLGWLGAGDVKLFAACGAWLGPTLTIDAAVIGAFVGGLMSLGWMLRSYGVDGTAVRTSLLLSPKSAFHAPPVRGVSKGALPYGVALVVGVLVSAWYPSLVSGVFHATR